MFASSQALRAQEYILVLSIEIWMYGSVWHGRQLCADFLINTCSDFLLIHHQPRQGLSEEYLLPLIHSFPHLQLDRRQYIDPSRLALAHQANRTTLPSGSEINVGDIFCCDCDADQSFTVDCRNHKRKSIMPHRGFEPYPMSESYV